MDRKTRPLLMTMLTLCLCTVVIVGGTFALFSDRVEINENHLVAGNLEIGLNRVSFKQNVLNDDGLMEVEEDLTPVNLAQSNSVLFDVTNAVPTSYYEAKIDITNLGTTAFDYSMKLLWSQTEDPDDKDEILAEQFEITVISKKISDADATGQVEIESEMVNCIKFKLSECNQHEIPLGSILKSGPQTESIIVKAEFVSNDAVNNNAMDASIKFDVQVIATQKVS